MSEPRVEIGHLSVTFPGALAPAVNDVSFHIDAGECLALVGESGSGKTLTALSLLGLVPPEATVQVGTRVVSGVNTEGFTEAKWRALRGNRVGLVSQDALVSLDPLREIGAEVGEVLELSRPRLPRKVIAQRVLKALELAGVPEPDFRKRQYPHELSGGLRQRALIASAIAGQPEVLIADEPTTALDSITQARVFDLLAALKESGLSLLLVSHDLGLVRQLADRIAVMREGRILECAPTAELLEAPQHPYTRELLEAVATRRPASGARSPLAEGLPALSCRGLHRSYPDSEGGSVGALRDVSFSVRPGTTMGIVGESGSGKSTLARILMALEESDSGVVELAGEPWSLAPERSRRPRRGDIQLIEQNPYDALNPRWSVGRILQEAVNLDSSLGPASMRRARVAELLDQVGLSMQMLGRRAHQLSGGQRQRVVIARALARRPSVLVCDEPVSALDASVRAQILALLHSLQRSLGLTVVLISHDLGIIAQYSDEVLVMREGRVIESGPRETVLNHPVHPFTQELLAASKAL